MACESHKASKPSSLSRVILSLFPLKGNMQGVIYRDQVNFFIFASPHILFGILTQTRLALR